MGKVAYNALTMPGATKFIKILWHVFENKL